MEPVPLNNHSAEISSNEDEIAIIVARLISLFPIS